MLILTAATEATGTAGLDLSITSICLRFLCAMLVGLVIGIEREYTHRPAGMRTHVLVALGACTVMVVGQLIFAQYRPYGASSDPARLSAQVISGVGFLGAGTIMREGANVKGLTTAASLWAVAGLGIAAGGGYYTVALVGTGFMFITLTVFELLQHVLVNPHSGNREFSLEADDVAEALKTINALASRCKCEIRDIRAEHLAEDSYRITFRAEFGRGKQKRRRQEFFEGLATKRSVRAVRSSDEAVSAK